MKKVIHSFLLLTTSLFLWTSAVFSQQAVFGVNTFTEYEAFLSAEQELGEENNSPAQGYGRLSFADDLSTAKLDVFIKDVDVNQITAFHIHCGSPNVLGPIIADLSVFGNFTDTIVNGHFAATLTNEHIVFVTMPPPAPNAGESFTLPLPEGCPNDYGQLGQVYTIAGLEALAKKGLLYFNLHTVTNPFYGEMRGQLYPLTQYKSAPTASSISFGTDSFTHYTANLSPKQELGEANGSQASGQGTVSFVQNLSYAQVELTINNLDASQLTAIHIHCGSPNVLGPYIIHFGDVATKVVNGKLSMKLTNKDIVFVTQAPPPPELGQSFTLPLPEGCPNDIGQVGQVYTIAGLEALARKGLLYFNVHTVTNAFYGEIRGQLGSEHPRADRAVYDNNYLMIPAVDVLDQDGKTVTYKADMMRLNTDNWLFELTSATEK
ncbi:CHRD domain-containing protein [Beggiatoa leptomitoformis]|uniref:CHRD domain-containing protein n=1 Tax=Beggiatoa leptomitoformis TaxID=288004 RepID=A0A2N9YF53_9GAMM|nr:CHRD domain-containing protein [Beggiatoa leptomitoformis]AUI69128.1 CHRD domain-containing protein [Beggiatoa leptomitoformis]QGX03758.1 CHRD domain-containing protein [Beggiatoa leptomitoformis]